MRYRLRLQLQEFDLPKGTTLIGRSYDCHVTIEDALVSRQHARIEVEGDSVSIFDLGSRNGVKVNGAPIKGSQELHHGDRVRIGTQDLLFTADTGRAPEPSKTTGFLQHCHSCHMPYSREAGACPTCGAVPEEADTQSDVAQSESAWTFELQLQVLERALSMGRLDDAARILGRAREQLEEALNRGEHVSRGQISLLLVAALRTSFLSRDGAWAVWAASVCESLSFVPTSEVLGWFQQLYGRFPELEAPISALVEHHRARAEELSLDETSVLTRLELLTQNREEDPFAQTAVSKLP
ncbi:MAG TPA: FHA domain-containing protein [Polyangiaceae bacterium]|nr:FHA domain-containing protein [Polyangiaceae bacterium]